VRTWIGRVSISGALAVLLLGPALPRMVGAQPAILAPLPPAAAGVPWPTVEWPTARAEDVGADKPGLTAAIDRAFAEADPDSSWRTRAVLIVYRGRLVAERYAAGFGPEARFPGWSVAKSVTNALCGVLVKEGRLSLRGPAHQGDWWQPGDARRDITIDHLLRMSDGLEWSERYEGLPSNVLQLLFGGGRRDMAAYAAGRRLAHAPDTHWNYSSGASLILSGLIRRAVGGRPGESAAFARRALFSRIGMQSALVEMDAAGAIVGSSYVHATARDYARFGLLYLRDGIWDGERILPEGWVDYTRTPSPTAPGGRYGAHFWLNAGSPADGPRPLPRVPRDAFYAWGRGGQFVVVVPSRDLVVVRLGLLRRAEPRELEALLAGVIAAIPPPPFGP
jgi:CubicO group peptidase (beta-lactamase class C family)